MPPGPPYRFSTFLSKKCTYCARWRDHAISQPPAPIASDEGQAKWLNDCMDIEAQERDTLRSVTLYSAQTTQSLALHASGAHKAVRY